MEMQKQFVHVLFLVLLFYKIHFLKMYNGIFDWYYADLFVAKSICWIVPAAPVDSCK